MKRNFYFSNQILCIILLCISLQKDPLKAESSLPNSSIFLELRSPGFGMFSVFTMVLGLMRVYERDGFGGVKVDFQDQGIYYDSPYGLNWWEYYFEPICLGNGEEATPYVYSTMPEQGNLAGVCEFGTSRVEAYHLIQKYVRVKAHIQSKVEEFLKEKFDHAWVIGIHYRGTDKFSEAPKVAYEKVEKEILNILQRNLLKKGKKKIKIFVATDEQPFLDYMVNKFPNVIFFEDNIRSTTGHPVHYYSFQNYKKGEDALLDCLLLSKCDILIRTSSNLSLCASYFNPNLPLINLSYRHGMNQ